MRVSCGTVLGAGALSVALLAADGLRAEAPLIDDRQSRLFAQACAHCHVKPGIGVPQLGDEGSWSLRRARGFETLLSHTVDGFGDMPPLGTCAACTEDDLRRLVAFIAGWRRLPDESEPAP